MNTPSNLKDKLVKVIESVATSGNLVASTNFLTGAIMLNGIELTQDEQFELMNEYQNDPTFVNLMQSINSTPQAKEIRKAVTFQGNAFEVNAEQVKKAFGIELASSKKGNVTVTDEKDREIAALRERIKELEGELAPSEESLTYPEDFYNASDDESVVVHELDEEEINRLVTDLKSVEVPVGSFAMIRVGDTVAIKMVDSEGTSYLVSDFYYIANV